MTGNIDDAMTAVREYRARNEIGHLFSKAGSTRMVYLINGVIYKVDGGNDYNVTEYDIITNIVPPAGFYFPNASLFTVGEDIVIAMDYIEGQAIGLCFCLDDEPHTRYCASDSERVLFDTLPRGFDKSGLNYIRTDKGLCIIDP